MNFLEATIGATFTKLPLGAQTLVRYLGDRFDEQVKETRVVEETAVTDLRASLVRVVTPDRPLESLIGELETLVGSFLQRSLPTSARLERDGEVYRVVCRSGEAVIIHDNTLVRSFYDFDAWFRTQETTMWLLDAYKRGRQRLEAEQGESFDTTLLVRKRYGPAGPVLFHSLLSAAGERVVTLNLRTGQVSEPVQGRACLYYDLATTGYGIRESATLFHAAGGGEVTGVVVLHSAANARVDIPLQALLDNPQAPSRTLPDDPLILLKEIVRKLPEDEFAHLAFETSHGDYGYPRT